MSDRELDHLRTVVGNLQRRIEALEARLALMPEAEPSYDDAANGAVALASSHDQDLRPAAVRAFFLLGRSILVLAGGFLLRALTEGGTLPPPVGFAAGVLYLLGLAFFIDRAGRREDSAGASALGITAVVVAYPFLGEATARLHLVSPTLGALGWVLVTGAGLAVAAHARLRLVAWAFTLGALGTGVLLYVAAGRPLLFTWLLLGLGAATLLLAYGRGWRLKRWLVAAVVDVLVLRLVMIASAPNAAEMHAPSPGAVMPLALALPIVYLALFTYRSLVLGKGVRAFYIVQSLAMLAIGYGGAVKLALAMGHGAAALGIAALVAAAAYYTVAFTIVRQRHGRGRAFCWFASLGLVFIALGSRVVAGGYWLPWCWLALGVGATLEANRTDRLTLHAHGVIYLLLGVMSSGLGKAAWHAFLGGTDVAWPGPGAAGVAVWLGAIACWELQLRSKIAAGLEGPSRIPRFGAALLALVGLGWAAVAGLVTLFGGLPPGGAGVAAVAVVRTGVLAMTVIALALAARRARWSELGWPVVPLLALGCVKLLIEDMRRGTPLTLTLGFALFGSALIIAPKLLMATRKAQREAVEEAS
jgi:hypothetical protein